MISQNEADAKRQILDLTKAIHKQTPSGPAA